MEACCCAGARLRYRYSKITTADKYQLGTEYIARQESAFTLEFTEQFKLLRAISCSSLCRGIVTASCSMDDAGDVALEQDPGKYRIMSDICPPENNGFGPRKSEIFLTVSTRRDPFLKVKVRSHCPPVALLCDCRSDIVHPKPHKWSQILPHCC